MFSPWLIFVKKTFVGRRETPGMTTDVMTYEAGKYYTVLFDGNWPFADLRGDWGHAVRKAVQFRQLAEIVCQIGDEGRGTSVFIKAMAYLTDFEEESSDCQSTRRYGVLIEQYVRSAQSYRTGEEEDRYVSGYYCDWLIQPKNLDHATLIGEFNIVGPYGVKGYFNGKLNDAIKCVIELADKWSKNLHGASREIAFMHLQELVVESGFFAFGGQAFQVKPSFVGSKKVVILGQPFAINSPAMGFDGNELPIRWREVVGYGLPIWSDGERVWVEYNQYRFLTCQEIYDLRELTGFCSGLDLHDFFRGIVGEPSPSGYRLIKRETLKISQLGREILELMDSKLEDNLPVLAEMNL